MDEHLETRVRLVGGGLQASLFGLAIMEFNSLGFVFVVVGAAVTLAGVV